MNKTDKKTLEEIIRVDHAGERGAIKIYEGQLLALKTFKQDEELKKKIEDMREHEKEHFEFFENEIRKRNIKPTKLLPLWDLMGITLGFGTAMMGKKAAMLCTASVEEVIDGHYKEQTYRLKDDEKELANRSQSFEGFMKPVKLAPGGEVLTRGDRNNNPFNLESNPNTRLYLSSSPK